jgi:hypothetical protein
VIISAVLLSSHEDRLDTLPLIVKQNNELQQSLNSKIANQEVEPLAVTRVQYQLRQLDKSIQQAYLQNQSQQAINNLWQSRLTIIESALNQPKATRTMRI